MDALATQIRTLLAQGFTPGEIAESMPEYDPATVRLACGQLTAQDGREILAVMYGMAMDHKVKTGDRIKAAIYVNEEINGRNEKRATTPMAVVSLVEFDQRLKSARRAALPARAQQVIECPAPAPAPAPTQNQMELSLA